MSTACRVLLIEDNKGDARLIHEMLKEATEITPFLTTVPTLEQGLEAVGAGNFDVILLDLSLPTSYGMETFDRVSESINNVPVIVLTGNTDELQGIEAVHKGAQDYLIKGQVDTLLLTHSIRYAIERNQLKAETERQAREAIKSKNRFRSMVEHNADAVVIIDVAGKIRFVNPAALSLFGKKHNQLIGKMFGFPITTDETTEIEIVKEKGAVRFAEMRLVKSEWESEQVYLASLRDITARKNAEAALEGERNLLRTLIDNIPDFIWIKDRNGRFLLANMAVANIMGVEGPEQLIGKSDDDFYPSSVADEYRKDEQHVINNATPIFNKEEENIYHDGTKRWTITTKLPYRNNSGDIVGVLGMGRDITERRLTEEALQRSEAFKDRIIESSHDCITVLSLDGTLRFMSMGGQHLLEIEDINHLIGTSWIDFWKGHDRLKAEEAVVKARNDELGNFEGYCETQNGTPKWWDIVISPITDTNGDVEQLLAISRDVTERKLAEEELRKLSIAVQQSPVSIVITDVDGNIEYVNYRFSEMTGYDYTEALGKNLRFLKSGEHTQEFYDKLWDTISTGKIWHGEICNKKKEGELFWESTTISPLKNEEGMITHYIGIKEDISEKKNLEDQLSQSQKMEAIGRFAGGIAHDFNNMMTAVIGFSDYLLSSRQGDDSLVSIIEQIKAAGQRAASLTQQLLAFSRRQVMESQLIDLQLIIGDMEKMLKHLIGEDIMLIISFEKKPSVIKADHSQVEQIIMNLVVNARDAMPEGGKLIIKTKTMLLDQDYCKEWINIEPGTYLVLSITDTGCGMSRETQAHIYEPFYTTKETEKGTGLGLSTVYGIVKQSGGHIHCYSEPKKGTTFNIYFPLIAEPTESVQYVEDEPDEAEIPRRSETVLIVEDENMVREIASSVLRNNGYRVLEAANSDEALAICRDLDTTIDLLITDVIMPGMQGPDLAREVLALSPKTAVLFISGYPDNAVEKLELFDSGNNFLQKPFTPKKLLRTIQELLA